MDVEQNYRDALGVSHVVALRAVFDAGVAHGLASFQSRRNDFDSVPQEHPANLQKVQEPAPAHPWDAFIKRLQG